jgi:hypothetical protein
MDISEAAVVPAGDGFIDAMKTNVNGLQLMLPP